MFNAQIYAGIFLLPMLATNLIVTSSHSSLFSSWYKPHWKSKHMAYECFLVTFSSQDLANNSSINECLSNLRFLQASFITSTRSLSLSHIGFKPVPKKGSVFMYIAILMIIQAHDTEINPGPYTLKYPCGVCGKAVRWSKIRTAVACDN